MGLGGGSKADANNFSFQNVMGCDGGEWQWGVGVGLGLG